MISVDEARHILKSNCFAEQTKVVHILSAVGCYLSSDVISLCNVPPFDNAAMDGYALKFNGGKTNYTVKNTIAAGDNPGCSLKEGEAVRIFTGAPIPENADTVIQQEICVCEGDLLKFDPNEIRQGANIRKTGAQSLKGKKILKKGTLVSPPVIALLASAGISQVRIHVPPSVAVIVTGKEVSTGSIMEPFQINDANGPALEAALASIKIRNTVLFHSVDDPVAMQSLVKKCLRKFDVLIVTGGVSVGEYDHTRTVMNDEGVIQLIYKLTQKPGKPFWAGKRSNKWAFGLPGNPSAVLTCFYQYVKPVIQSMCGNTKAWESYSYLPLHSAFEKKKEITQFVKVKKENDGVRILNGQDSFDLSAFAEANGMAELEIGKEFFNPGDLVKVYDL